MPDLTNAEIVFIAFSCICSFFIGYDEGKSRQKFIDSMKEFDVGVKNIEKLSALRNKIKELEKKHNG